MTSIKNAISDYTQELDLIESFLDFPNLDAKLAENILHTLNPYNPIDIEDRIHSPCFIGFSQPDILFSDESEYISKYSEIAKEYVRDFYSKAENKGLNIEALTLLLLPFKCVTELTEEFISYIGVSK